MRQKLVKRVLLWHLPKKICRQICHPIIGCGTLQKGSKNCRIFPYTKLRRNLYCVEVYSQFQYWLARNFQPNNQRCNFVFFCFLFFRSTMTKKNKEKSKPEQLTTDSCYTLDTLCMWFLDVVTEDKMEAVCMETKERRDGNEDISQQHNSFPPSHLPFGTQRQEQRQPQPQQRRLRPWQITTLSMLIWHGMPEMIGPGMIFLLTDFSMNP